MSDTDQREETQGELNSETNAAAEVEKQRLALEVKVDERSTCERHVTVTIPHEDIDRYFDKEFSELMPTAHVPGFRPGRAPRKLVENRFRKELAGKVKSELLMDSLGQVNDEQKLSAISEPEFDLEAVELPDEGSLTFEFDIEVRPEFELPQWKGLAIEKPVREFADADVDQTLQDILSRRGRLVPHDGPAASGDYITANLTFKHDDKVLSSADEEVIRIRPTLSFRDGKIEHFDTLMSGVRAGETREGEIQLSEDAPNVELRGKKAKAVFKVLEVKKLEVPELTPELLEELGGFQDEAELRDAIRDQLARQLEYEQHRLARQQITKALTVAASWELPPELLRRQSHRELQRAVMELQRSGFSDEMIRAHENALRQNATASTAQALKEHFILERIAEDEKIEADEGDYEAEVRLIAAQSGESPRRVRARLEKGGSMDVLRNQIIERKVIERILENAKFKETPYEFRRTDEEAIDQAAGGGQEADIPEAKYDEGETVPEAKAEGQGTGGEKKGA
ncbi:MAG: trigger factor [Planctomycetaceae bacterium]|nr:trigger factor [Planctomycetaceae bacterium]